jgi:hypothetical protein
MAIIKRVIREDFEVVLRSTMQDKSISLDTKGLLFFLLSLPSSWEIHVWWLKRELHIGDDKIKRMLKELVTTRYLIRKRVNSGGGLFNWEMEVHPEPQPTIVGLPIDGSTTDGSAINGKPNDKENTESADNTELENRQPQPHISGDNSNEPAEQVVVEGNLIFDKAINQNIHQKLLVLLANIEPSLAQRMLDTLAAMGEQAKYPLKLIKSFVENQAEFDPTPGQKIAIARDRKKANEVAYQAATSPLKSKPNPRAAAIGEAIFEKVRKKR